MKKSKTRTRTRRIRIRIRIKRGKGGTPHYPRTDRQPVRNPINIGPNALSNRQPPVNNVKDRPSGEKICEFLSNFAVSINNKPSGNRQQIVRSWESNPDRNRGAPKVRAHRREGNEVLTTDDADGRGL